jgi:uncharacterized membrane protein
MRVLLLNDNPVVDKLVTLSVEKAGHELVKAGSIGAIEPGRYDLLIVEEGLYDSALVEELGSFISFSFSMLIAARDTVVDDLFDRILNKPFLPTELLLMLHQTAVAVEAEGHESEIIDLDLLSAERDGNANEQGEGAYVEPPYIRDAEEADEGERMNPAEGFEPDEAIMPDRVLDEEDVRAVQDLLEDVESIEEPDGLSVHDAEDIIERATLLSAMEEEINEALMELSDEELMEPADESLLLDIVSDEVHGEESEPEEEATPSFPDEGPLFDHDDLGKEKRSMEETDVGIKAGNIEGIEALYALLDVLQNEELAKSVKGSITINISFGEKQ